MMDEVNKHDSCGCLLLLMVQDGRRRGRGDFIVTVLVSCHALVIADDRSGRKTPIDEARKPEVVSAFKVVDVKLELNYDWS